MSGNNDFSGFKIKASVSFMVVRIAKKDARRGSIREFMVGIVVLVWVAKRTKDS